jgi:mannosyltransferase
MGGLLAEARLFRARVAFMEGLLPWLLPTAIGMIALQVRLHGLGDKPFWLDEVASLNRATSTLPDLVAGSLHSKHYPTYFLFLWLVAKLGASPWVLRLPSAVFGAISAGLVCAIGRDIDSRRTGIAAGLLLALSPFDVQYGQEARSYTLVGCLILVALWGLVRLAREPATAACPLRRNRVPPLAWLAYCGGTAAALNVLNVAVPWVVAANLAALAIAHRAGDARAAFWRNWGIAQAFITATWLPSLAAVYIVSGGAVLRGSGWAPPETIATIWSIAAPVYLFRITAFITSDLMPAAVPGLSVVIAVMATYGAWRLRHNPTVLTAISCGAFVLPMLLVLVSLVSPVLVPRYFAWSAGPFFLLAGAGIGRLRHWHFAGFMAVFGALCLANLMPYYKSETKPRWDLAAAKLATEAQPGDVVLLNSWYSHYVLTAFAARSGLDDHRLVLTWEPTDAAQFARGHGLWVMFGRAGQGAMGTPEDYVNSLSWLGRPLDEERIGRHIILWRFSEPEALAACGTPPACPNWNQPRATR